MDAAKAIFWREVVQMGSTIAITSVVALLVASPVACTVHQNVLIAEAIKAGADPVATRCAFEASSSATCAALIQLSGTKK